MTQRANALAARLEQGAASLAGYVSQLTDAEWRMAIPKDGRTVGVVVHHVASVYPLELELAQTIARGKPVQGVTWEGVHKMNAAHALENSRVDRPKALALLNANSRKAAADIRAMTDAQLDTAANCSLNSDAPLTAQFIVEDHAVRHSYHHLARIRAAVEAARGHR